MYTRLIIAATITFCAMISATHAVVIEWTDGAVGNANWNDGDNWDALSEPTVSDDAEHETSASDTEVNTTSATCSTFTGDGSAAADRFMVLKADKKLTLGGTSAQFTNAHGFTGTGSARFPVKFEAGSSGLTELNLPDGNVDNVTFSGSGGAADDVKIVVGGHIYDSYFSLRHGVDIDVSGDILNDTGNLHLLLVGDEGDIDVIGDVSGMDVRAGTSTASTGTTITVGSIGENTDDGPDEGTDPDGIVEDWLLKANTDLTVEGNYIGDEPASGSFLSLVELTDNATMTVEGDTYGSDWHIFDESVFTADTANTVVNGGEWEIENNGRVIAEEIAFGDWFVESDGNGTGQFGVEVANEFYPDLLVVKNGTVKCDGDFGVDPNLPLGEFPIWDMRMEGDATVEVVGEGWHEGEDSDFLYTGSKNVYDAREVEIGPLTRTNGGTMEFQISQYFSREVPITEEDGTTHDFDAEGVTLAMTEGQITIQRSIETIGIDYSHDQNSEDFNPDNVLFSDAVCIRRYEGIVIKDSGVTPHNLQATTLVDKHTSTPMSGNVPAIGEETEPFFDGVYTIDLTVDADARLHVGLEASTAPQFNIYYTGKLTNNGTIVRWDEGTSAWVNYTPVLLSVTTYGDFDGDSVSNDSADVTRFNDHWCSCAQGSTPDADYDPLVDWNCDGAIDDTDRDQFEDNWPNATGVTTATCSAACP